jgi:hypothetical protein
MCTAKTSRQEYHSHTQTSASSDAGIKTETTEPLFEIRDSPERAGWMPPSKSHAHNQDLYQYVSEPVTGARGRLPLSSARFHALNLGHQPPAKCRQQLLAAAAGCWLLAAAAAFDFDRPAHVNNLDPLRHGITTCSPGYLPPLRPLSCGLTMVAGELIMTQCFTRATRDSRR